MTTSLAFPFSSDPGLCKILRNHDLWASAVDERVFRHAIKRVSKKVFHTKNLTVTDDFSFGEACIKLLASLRGRAALEKEASLLRIMGICLSDYVRATYDEQIPGESEFLQKLDEVWQLNVMNLAKWVETHEVAVAHCEPLALLGCAFAIRQPNDALEVGQILTRRNPAFVPLLCDHTHTAAKKSDTENADKGVENPSARTENPHEHLAEISALSREEVSQTSLLLEDHPTPKQPCSVVGDELLTILARPADWACHMHLSQWRRAVELLNERAQAESAMLSRLDELVEAVRCDAAAARVLPWWYEPLDLGNLVQLRRDAPAESERKRLLVIQQELARLMQAHSRYEVLLTRLRQPCEPWLAGGQTALATLADAIEERAALFADRLEQLSLSINRSNALLDQLAVADAESATRLMNEISFDAGLELIRFIFDPSFETEATSVRRAALRDLELGGLLLAHLRSRDQRATAECAKLLIQPNGADLPIEATVLIFGWFTLGQLQQLACDCNEIAPTIVLLMFTAAIRLDRPEILDYVEPLLHDDWLDATSRDFFRTLRTCQHRGRIANLSLDLRRATITHGECQSADLAAEQQRRKVLDYLDLPPGMKKTFHLLRAYAQVQFLHPLRPAIEAKDAPLAWRLWEAFGGLDMMVETCIGHLKPIERPESRHHQQTRNYLEHFQEELSRWLRIQTGSTSSSIPELVRSIRALHRQSPRAPMAAAVLRTIDAADTINILPEDFGRRVSDDMVVTISPEMREPFLRPTMLASWPCAVQGSVPLANLLSDRLRENLGESSMSLSQAVETYIEEGRFEAARCAAGENQSQVEAVDTALARHREALLVQHAELLAEAASARGLDENVAEYLSAAERALEEDEFDEATAALDLLRECVREFRHRNDPVRMALLDFLAEAGVAGQAGACVEDLETLAQEIREDQLARRRHISALLEAAAHERAPEPVQKLWPDAARRLDRPALWPDPDTSALLAEAIPIIAKTVRGKWHNRLDDADPSTAIVRRVAEWTPDQLGTGFRDKAGDALNRVLELTERLEEGCGDAAILRFLGENPAIGAVVVPMETAPPAPAAAEPKTVSAHGAPPLSALASLLDAEPAGEAADLVTLQKASRNGEWARARAFVVGVLKSGKQIAEDLRQDMLAIYSFALFHIESTAAAEPPPWLAEACIAVVASRRAAGHWLGEKAVHEFMPRVVLRALPELASRMPGDTLYDHLGRVIETAAGLPASASEYLWLADFFRRSEGVAPRLAAQMWERFTGLSRNEHYRCALLQVLFRSRQQEALRTLAAEVPDRVKSLVRTTLEAFTAAEAQPEARPAALQLSAALRDQASGVANTKPWILFFHSLQSARDAAESAPLSLELDSEFVAEDTDGGLSVELRVKPSLFAPPDRLTLIAGGGSPIALCDEALFTERVARVPLPAGLEFSALGECSLPWRVDGQTTLGQKIALSGTWLLHRTGSVPRLSEERLALCWPGAKCEPVKRDHGFFGRLREIRLIESYLTASPRPRSVMVYGERRIGKTSLLQTIIMGMPPSRGRICGAFCDVSGLRAPGPDESLAGLFFRKILAALENRDDNGAILDALSAHRGHTVSPARLGRDLDADTSLFAALTMLVQRLEEHSGGVIRQLALFIDEFDRFTAPLLLKERQQVDSFLWELREVVQRSERVALVLAGSGIQRLLKENYQDALYGSIAEVHLPRFQWAVERAAILDTFLPGTVRDQLCQPGEAVRIAEYAARLCGGHPMFLALLGRTAAALADGRLLTTGLLDRVVERLVRSDGPHQAIGLERKIFYECVFQPLEVLPPKEYALAKGLFVTLAELTTPSDARFASFQVSRLLEVSGLLQYADTRQALQALDRLAKAEAIVNENARVRISVPLSAAAVREDALLLRDDVIHSL